MENTASSFVITISPSHAVIQLKGDITPMQAKAFEEQTQKLLAQELYVLIGCDGMDSFSVNGLRILVTLVNGLKKCQKEVRFFHVSDRLKNYFQQQGVDSVFKVSIDEPGALGDLGLAAKNSLDVEFVNPFLMATLNVLQVQSQTMGHAGKLYAKKQGDKSLGDISGVIGIVSPTFNGSVVISFPEKTFLKIISRMLGDTFTELSQDIEDGAAELVNMIFGQAKVELNKKGYGIQTALPSVVSGKDHSFSASTKGPVVVVPFETDVGPFCIEIGLSA